MFPWTDSRCSVWCSSSPAARAAASRVARSFFTDRFAVRVVSRWVARAAFSFRSSSLERSTRSPSTAASPRAPPSSAPAPGSFGVAAAPAPAPRDPFSHSMPEDDMGGG